MLKATVKHRCLMRSFLRRQDGAATVDWVIVCAGAVGAGMIALNLGQEALRSYSSDVRREVQGAHFDTSWVQAMDFTPSGTWPAAPPIVPTPQVIEDGSTAADPNETVGGDPAETEDPNQDAPDPTQQDDGTQTGSPGSEGGTTETAGGTTVMPPPDPPIITNGDFNENTSEGWFFMGNGVLMVYNYSLAFNAADSAPGGLAFQAVRIQPGAFYQLSLDAYEHGGGVGSHTLVVDVVDSQGGFLVSQTYLVVDGSRQSLTLPFIATTEWVMVRFTNPSSTATIATDLKIDNVVVTRF